MNIGTRVYCTGAGVISPLGHDRHSFWSALRSGDSGITEVTLFDTTGLRHHRAGEVRGFRPADYMQSSRYRRMDRYSQMAVAAVGTALRDARLQVTAENAAVVGSVLSTTFGPSASIDGYVQDLKYRGPLEVSPSRFPNTVLNAATGQISMEFGLKGPSSTLAGLPAAACCFDLLRERKAAAMVASAIDELDRTTYTAYSQLGLLDRITLGEGAAAVVLEAEGAASSRGAAVLAELFGYASLTDPDLQANVATEAPSAETVRRCMALALQRAGIGADRVGAVVLMANGGAVDAAERQALEGLFPYGGPALLPLKRLTGENFHCHSVLGLVAAILMIHHGTVPATAPGGPQRSLAPEAPFVLVNAMDLGGSVSTVVVGPAREGVCRCG